MPKRRGAVWFVVAIWAVEITQERRWAYAGAQRSSTTSAVTAAAAGRQRNGRDTLKPMLTRQSVGAGAGLSETSPSSADVRLPGAVIRGPPTPVAPVSCAP